jgi:hypothetical protein
MVRTKPHAQPAQPHAHTVQQEGCMVRLMVTATSAPQQGSMRVCLGAQQPPTWMLTL